MPSTTTSPASALPGSAWDFYPWSHEMRVPFAQWRWLALIPIACALLTLDLAFVDLFALAYFAAVYSMAFAVYHGDSGELDRHMVLTAALYRFAPIVALAPVWERLRPLWYRPTAPFTTSSQSTQRGTITPSAASVVKGFAR